MFTKILVGIDTSVETHHAFDDALSIAEATGAALNLMHVFSWDDAYDECLALLYPYLEEDEGMSEARLFRNGLKAQKRDFDTNKEVEEILELDPFEKCIISRYRGHEQSETLIKYRATAQKAGVQAEIEPPRRGRPGNNLCNAARMEKADLIAVGHRDKDWGKTLGLGEFRLGSVSHEIIHRAPCSVLIAHRFDVGVGALTNMDRILTALDDSVMSQVVFQESLDLAKATGANLTLLHVLSPFERNHPLEKLNLLKDQANAVGISVSFEQLTSENDSIGKVICEFAAEKKTNLIIIGRRKLLEVQEQVLGSVSHYVAYHAPCAAIIVQPSPMIVKKA